MEADAPKYEEVEFSRDQEDVAEDVVEALNKKYQDCIMFVIQYNEEVHGEFSIKEYTKDLVVFGDKEFTIRVRRES